MSTLHFQYCQKLVVYSKDEQSILLCKRKGEADYDGVFSFIWGKMETTDGTLVEGMQREKNEEVGENFKIRVFPSFTTNAFFLKKDGNAMVLPHIYAIHQGGEIVLNEEYSEYQRVPLAEIEHFEPKIGTIPEVLEKFKILKETIHTTEGIII